MIAEVRALLTQEILELRALLLDLDRRQKDTEQHVERLLEDARRAEKRRKRARTAAPAAGEAKGGSSDEEEASELPPGTTDPALDDQPDPG